MPDLVEFGVLSDELPAAANATLPAKLAPFVGFQETALLSRRDRAALRAAPRLVQPIFDAERLWLVLDAGEDEARGVYVLTETRRLLRVLQAEPLLDYAAARGAVFLVYEAAFAFSAKVEDFALLVLDMVLFGEPHTFAARRHEVDRLCAFAGGAQPALPFDVLAPRCVPCAGPELQKLLSSVMWHQETESRVLMHDEKHRFAVLGLRLVAADSPYVPGAVNPALADWIFPRQFPYLVRLFVAPGSEAIVFGFRDAAAGALALNPAHVPAVVAKLGESDKASCICKLVFDPTKGLYNVRAVYAHGTRRLTTAAQAFQAAQYSSEAITKEELVAWAEQKHT